MSGIRCILGVAPTKQSAPVTFGDLRAMIANLPNGIRGVGDQALLLVGFARPYAEASWWAWACLT